MAVIEPPKEFPTKVPVTRIAETGHSKIELVQHPKYGLAVMKKTWKSDERSTARWRNEVNILNKVSGPAHISQILESEETDLSILLRLERGMSLDRCVHPETMLSTASTSNVVALWTQMAGALDYLHARRITHDDVKPENIMWHAETNLAVLIDFGAAIYHPKNEQPQFTPSGTPPYAPPEYLDSRKGPAGDVWALGVTMLFAMGYIKLPDGAWILPHALQGKDDSRPRKEMLEWLSNIKLWAETLHSQQETLARMLDPDPDKRITSSELAQELQAWTLNRAKQNPFT